MKLICPKVHLNGTAKQDLLDAIEEAYLAIDAAVDAMKKTAPNGRDYYMYHEGAFEEARQQYWSQMSRLQSVKDEFEVIVRGIESGETYMESE